MTTESFTLPRTGKPPLRFTGRLLAESDGRWTNGKDNNRYHDLALFQTEGGKFVVHIHFETAWQGELDRDLAVTAPDAAAAGAALTGYDPCAALVGYPPRAEYEDRQQRLMQSIRGRYEAQVSELLGALEYAEDADADSEADLELLLDATERAVASIDAVPQDHVDLADEECWINLRRLANAWHAWRAMHEEKDDV